DSIVLIDQEAYCPEPKPSTPADCPEAKRPATVRLEEMVGRGEEFVKVLDSSDWLEWFFEVHR
ncbi:hypothetical protein N7530_005543, partial [Penicillium desertorum]